MNTTIKYTNLLILALAILWSCNEKETELLLPDDFENGILISNEGSFGSGDASLSYYDLASQKVFNNVFSLVNDGKEIGDVMQSIYMNQDHAFLVVNNSNKVEALNLADMTFDFTIDNLKLPRYMISDGDKGYVSEWVSFSDVGRVSIVDLVTGEVQKTIDTDYGAEGVIIAENKLFVSNNFSTTLTVIDPSTETVTKTIDVGSSPGEMVMDTDGDIWLICGGGYDANYHPLEDGKLVEINPATVEIKNEVDLGMNVNTKIAIDPAGKKLYYFSGTSVYEHDVELQFVSGTPFISAADAVSFNGIGVDGSGNLYLGDSKGFVENGEVFIYGSDGTFMEKFSVGRGPNGFILN
ncbi:MAG: hypothetical protein RLO17_01815 [Cyclobacteriaceae bacterium]